MKMERIRRRRRSWPLLLAPSLSARRAWRRRKGALTSKTTRRCSRWRLRTRRMGVCKAEPRDHQLYILPAESARWRVAERPALLAMRKLSTLQLPRPSRRPPSMIRHSPQMYALKTNKKIMKEFGFPTNTGCEWLGSVGIKPSKQDLPIQYSSQPKNKQ